MLWGRELTMVDTASLRHQHDELLELARRLEEHLTLDGAVNHHQFLHALLEELGTSLSQHLEEEDEALYASLLESLDPAVQRFSLEFREEMDAIVEAFDEYEHRWPTGTSIRRDPTGFVAHSKWILPMLERRLERENERLYPIADRE